MSSRVRIVDQLKWPQTRLLMWAKMHFPGCHGMPADQICPEGKTVVYALESLNQCVSALEAVSESRRKKDAQANQD